MLLAMFPTIFMAAQSAVVDTGPWPYAGTNLGAESAAMTGWTDMGGTMFATGWSVGRGAAPQGDYFFYAVDPPPAEHYYQQTFDLELDVGVPVDQIDAAGIELVVDFWAGRAATYPDVTVGLNFYFSDADLNPLGDYFGTQYAVDLAAPSVQFDTSTLDVWWAEKQYTIPVPAGTRFVVVEMAIIPQATVEAYCEGYLDDIRITAQQVP